MVLGRQQTDASVQDPRGPQWTGSRRVDWCPPLVLNLAMALQHVLVQCSLLVLTVGMLQCRLQWTVAQRGQHLASLLFSSALATLLHTCTGSCLPLMQAPSLEMLVPALVLLSAKTGNEEDCRGQYSETERCDAQGSAERELQGMVVVAGLLQVCVGVCGLGGVCLRRCGPLVLAPLLCVLGLSIYREAALLCSDHWGFAALAVFLMVILSQHLRSVSFSALPDFVQFPFYSMLSVLLPVLIVWGVCVLLEFSGHLQLHTLSDLLPDPGVQNETAPRLLNDTHTHTVLSSGPSLKHSGTLPWISLPHTGVWRPLLSGRATAAGVAAALGSCCSSMAVYCLSSRFLGAPQPPAHACNRGLLSEGLATLTSALLGSTLGVVSSTANVCTLELSQCGSRRTVQLAAILGLLLGLSPRLTVLLSSIPLVIYGAILCVTYAVATATGVTYFQYGHMDSGRNIFNIGFTTFMALVLPRWFRLQPDVLSIGQSSANVFLLSVLTSPMLLIFLMAFLLENSVSGSLAERGLTRVEGKRGETMLVLSDGRQNHDERDATYEPPYVVRRLLAMPYLRVVPFYACRLPDRQEVATPTQEMTNLLAV
ncbi:solute carrier family 23 member 3 [Alosa sapidissima]|uniref:solute carrier family 23 member 3 n=1 Tax=Alosa sapidissima TaxID=34773 RepID=UPI001C0A1073|nr:solute carrier family 23 member 3 [Alosa sapidissima]